MFTFKPKKVFEKLNKMDRKQAYTIGAIAVVCMVALLMLVSVATGNKDDSFDGMSARGYDLANMPFATDEAEKYLLANAYPDMKENGSTLLYSAAEKEARQEEDAQAVEEEAALSADENNVEDITANTYRPRSDNGGYSGYSRRGNGGSGPGKTEVGQLGSASMAHSGGSVLNATGPTGDFRQFKGREDRGNEAPIQLKTGNARQALAQFRQGSRAAATFKENRMTGARKALLGGNVAGSEAMTKDGVDLSKLQNGGLTLDTDAPPTSTDLDNLDKKVAEAAKKAEKKKEEEKTPWWLEMLQDLAKSAANALVNSFMNAVGDTIGDTIQGNRASRAARKQYGADLAGKEWSNCGEKGQSACGANQLTPTERAQLDKVGVTADKWTNGKVKERTKWGSETAAARAAGAQEKAQQIGVTDTASSRRTQQDQQQGGPKLKEGEVQDRDGRTCLATDLKDNKCP